MHEIFIQKVYIAKMSHLFFKKDNLMSYADSKYIKVRYKLILCYSVVRVPNLLQILDKLIYTT